MLFYILLDLTQSLIWWIIKNLGYASYYSIRYLFYGNELTEEEIEKKKQLELLIKNNEDLEKIKEFINEIKKNK